MISWVSSPYGLAAAWQHSMVFWQQTLAAVSHHWPALLAVVIIPAALRAYLTLKVRPIQRWELNLSEALLTVCRILICGVAIWALLSYPEWQTFKLRLRNPSQFQLAVQRLGASLGKSLHILLWELLIFAFGFWLLHILLSFLADCLARAKDPERHVVLYRAIGSVLRNMILTPLALIYLVAMMRQAVW